MSEVAIPAAAQARLRNAYAAFEQTAQIVADALNIPPNVPRRLDLERGAFFVEDVAPNGQVHEPVPAAPATPATS